MKKLYNYFFALSLFCSVSTAFGQIANISVSPSSASVSATRGSANETRTFTITNSGNSPLQWSLNFTGETVSFAKGDFEDFELQQNQDRITNSVWITRKNRQGIFNIRQEDNFSRFSSPVDTEWSFGNTADLTPGDYTGWNSAVNGNPPSQVGETLSLHIIPENRFFDVNFTSWTSGNGDGGGGGFAYTRTEIPAWVSASQNSGSVAPGENFLLTLTFDADAVPDGLFNANLNLTTDADNISNITIPLDFTVTGGESEISIDDVTVDFDDTPIGATSSVVVEIENTGDSPLNISGFTFDESVFTTNQGATVIEAGGLEFIEFLFVPSSPGVFSGVLTIASDDPNSANTVVNLTGEGVNAADLSLSQTSLSSTVTFGNNQSEILTLQNNGTGTLTWALDLVVDGTVVNFSKENFADFTLAVNQDRINDDVWITRGDNRGLFNILQEEEFNRGNRISPIGTEWTGTSTLQSDPGNYDTWNNAVGFNPSGAVGRIISMHLVQENRFFDVVTTSWSQGGNGGGFSYSRVEVPGWVRTDDLGGTISGGASLDIDFSFMGNLPAGTYNAIAILTTNDPGQEEINIPLSITITGTPEIDLATTDIDFGPSFIGLASTEILEITNTGGDNLNVSSIVSDNGVFTINPTSATIPSGRTVAFNVDFTATAEGVANGNLTITSDDPTNNSLMVSVTGDATTPANIVTTPGSFTLDIPTGTTLNGNITIQNTQGEDLTWGINAPVFVQLSATNGSTASGVTSDISIAIDPDNVPEGTTGAEIIISSNDPVSPEIIIPVTFTGNMIPRIDVSPSAIDYGDVFVSFDETRELIVENVGSAQLEVTGIAFDNSVFSTSTSSLSIPAGESDTLMITLSPNVEGTINGLINLVNNDPDFGNLAISLTANGLAAPVISVDPLELNYTIFDTETEEQTLTISNTAGTDLDWIVAIEGGPLTPPNVLVTTNANASDLVAAVPNSFAFNYDGGLGDISDGGNDMYDGGNRMSTDIFGGTINYSDNEVADGTNAFGPGTSYFTRHLEGMFVMGASLNGVNSFEINGNNGADGQGSVDGAVLEVNFSGRVYQGFLKRVFGTTDPSINHLIIIEKNTNASQTFSTDTDNDFHRVTGLANTDELFYLLYAGTGGFFIDNASAEAIMIKFLESLPLIPEYLSLSTESGTNASGTNTEVTAELIGSLAPEGNTNFNLLAISNDPATPEVVIPVSINAGNIIVENPIDDIIINEGFVTTTVDLTNVFTDFDSDPLTFLPAIVDENLATLSLSGTTLTITEGNFGTTLVSIAAQDDDDNINFANFNFRSNAIPEVVSSLSDLSEVINGFGTQTIDLAPVFSDRDAMDVLSFTVTSSDENVITASIDGTELTLTEVGLGVSTITVTAADGVGGEIEDSFSTTLITGITEDLTKFGVSLFPNPANQRLNIEFNNPESSEVSIQLIDMVGKVHIQESVSTTQASVIDLTNLSAGTYIIRMELGDEIILSRILKQ